MDKKRISISTQNKLILLGLVVSTVLIVGLAVFAITNIQQKISEVYGGFGEILTKTLAIESVEITKDVQEFDKFSALQAHTKSIIDSNNEIAFIDFKDAKNNVIFDVSNDNPTLFKSKWQKFELNFEKWQNLFHQDEGSVVEDPMIFQLNEFDFTISENSPAINLGFVPINGFVTTGKR